MACEPWKVVAIFAFDDPATGAYCCEYRQYVRSGPIWVIPPHGEPTPVVVPRERWDEWYEDEAAPDAVAAAIRRYGHRSDKRTYRLDQPVPSDGYFGTSDLAGQASVKGEPKWMYGAEDAPHYSPPRYLVPRGSRLLIDVEFRGSIIDTCTGRVVITRDWTWIYDGLV